MLKGSTDLKGILAREIEELGSLIAAIPPWLSPGHRTIEGSRLIGTSLLTHSVELARGFRACLKNGMTGAAMTLSRAQYESALRGHIIINEIPLEDLNALLSEYMEWRRVSTTTADSPPPKIAISPGKGWAVLGRERGSARSRKIPWKEVKDGQALEWQKGFLGDMMLLFNDLAHSGLIQGEMNLRNDGKAGANYPLAIQVQLLFGVERTVLFAATAWPGVMEKHSADVVGLAEELYAREAKWHNDCHR